MRLPYLGTLLYSFAIAVCAPCFGQPQSYLRNNSFVNFESPQVHPLDITPDGSKLLAVNTANNSLEIFNVASAGQAPTLIKSVPVGLDPVTVRARTNKQAWVVNVISDSVSIVDLQNGIVTQTLQADDEPADVVFAGTSQSLAYVSCAQAKTLMVFNAAAPGAVQQRIPINGEQPRALATSVNGRYVYLAIFESGNGTTLLPGGVANGFEHDAVRDTRGPYGGVNAPPNSGTNFVPAVNPANPAPIPVSIIIRRTAAFNNAVQWLDDNNHDWSAFVTGNLAVQGTPGDRVAGWDLPDRDVAVIDTGSNNAVSYQARLMNMVMSIGVNPASGAVSVVGTDATNQIRWEPNLQGTFLKVEGASFTPGSTNTIYDLNPQLNYKSRNIPVAQRQLSVGDPRAIVWNAAGTISYISGMGSNNVVLADGSGNRLGLINVGQGPTGLVLNEANNRAFVLNRFDGTISTLNISNNTQTFVTPLMYDPTPSTIKLGRPFLYDTHLNSGLGQLSCASCHVDSRTDRLAWDLGNPAGTVVTNSQGISYHPMKGPMLTMTMVDMIQAPFLHWRGDRQLNDFEGAFQTLQGADAPQTDANMALLGAFFGTITLPPNPYRNLDNSYSTTVNMPGPNNTVYITGNAVAGAQEFEQGCRSCHFGETNRSPLFITGNTAFGVGVRNPPNWKNFYKRIGLWFGDPAASNEGFGFQQDGSFDSTQNQSRDANMYAFMMSMNGGYPYEPGNLNATNWSNNAHAAVGKQVTLSPSNPTDTTGLLAQLETLAGQGAIGLVAKGAVVGSPVRGYMYLGNNQWQSDRLAEVDSTSGLMSAITSNTTLTFTAVPTESAPRIGIDMDGDGLLDSDDPNPNVPNAAVTNLALKGTATGSPAYDTNHQPAAAIDGSTMGYYDQNQMYVSQDNLGTNDWWQVDLGSAAQISMIQLFNRWDCCATRLQNVSVFVSQAPFTSTSLTATRSQPGVQEFFLTGAVGMVGQIPMATQGRYVRVELNDTVNALQLAEVRVLGYATGTFNNPGPQSNPVGTTVSLPLTFTNTTGSAYTFSAVNLPPGLSINSSTGAITGTITSTTASATYAVTVTAAGPGNPTTSFSWNVPQGSQAITFSTIPTQAVGSTLALSATTSSGLPVSYASSTSSICTVSGSTLSALKAGTCTIVASQGGNSNYTAATPVSQSFTIGTAAAPVPVSVGLASVSNVYAIASNGVAVTHGGFDTSSYAYSASVLPSTIKAGGVSFTLGAPGVADAVSNATVPLPAGSYGSLSFLAAANYGSQAKASFVLNYTDGTTSTFTQGISDWGAPQSYAGETIAAKMAYRLTATGSQDNTTYYVYAYTATIPSGKVVKSITLPQTRNVVVMALTLTPLAAVTVNLSSVYNVYGIANNGVAVTNGGFDTASYAYSANALPGTIMLGGVPATLGPAGSADAVTSSTVTLPPGNFAALALLGGAAFGALANQPFVVTYTDGSTTTFTQSMSDWGYPQNFAGETSLVSEASRVTPTGTTSSGPWYMYGYTFLLNPAKTVSSIKLPNNRYASVFAMTLLSVAP